MKVLTGTLVTLSNALTAALCPYPGHNQHYHPNYNNHPFMREVNHVNNNGYQRSIEQIDEDNVFTELN